LRHSHTTSRQHAEGFSRFAANREKPVGDIAEDHGACTTLQRPEADQPLPTADIQQRLACLEPGSIEHLVA
jgi:hypothetical protein